MIYVVADTHGSIDIEKLSFKNWPESKTLSKNDYLIIAGDFGLFWDDIRSSSEQYWLKWLNDRPYTTIFIDGNHENFNVLNSFPITNRFGKNSIIGETGYDSIFHSRRGSILEIDNKTIFTFGGAWSIDRKYRKLNKTYWLEEMPTYTDLEIAINNLSKFNNNVDYVITHACHTSGLFSDAYRYKISLDYTKKFYFTEKYKDKTSDVLEILRNHITYKKWFCGHYHLDCDIPEYNTVIMDRTTLPMRIT